jgi:hypothetical protein
MEFRLPPRISPFGREGPRARNTFAVRFAMLEILTKRPGRWATFDELGGEIATADAQKAPSRFSELSDVDVLGAGLVENNGLISLKGAGSAQWTRIGIRSNSCE